MHLSIEEKKNVSPGGDQQLKRRREGGGGGVDREGGAWTAVTLSPKIKKVKRKAIIYKRLLTCFRCPLGDVERGAPRF